MAEMFLSGKGECIQISKKTDLVEDFSIKQGDRIGLTSKGKYKIVDDADGVLIKASSKKKLLLEGVTYDKVIAAGSDLFVQPIGESRKSLIVPSVLARAYNL